MGSGERLPALLDDDTGLPLFEPMAYVLSEVRAKSRAANTIADHLAAIALLLVHTRASAIDLAERVASGRLLELHEIDGIAAALRLKVAELIKRLPNKRMPIAAARQMPISLESVRQRLPENPDGQVDAPTAANRMRVIHAYLAWLVNQRLGRLEPKSEAFGALMAKRDLMLQAIAARVPAGAGSQATREGLHPDARAILLRIIDPASPSNPWRDHRVRRRNQLIVLFLYHFGLRGGELLGLQLQDVDFRANTVRIVRRPDNPVDPRRIQPVVKTLGRILPMNQGLADLAFAHLADRRAIAGAVRHPFLFVETDRGRPLSARGLANVFRDLRVADQVLAELTPHVLRHDWNDRFSDTMDRRETPEPIEEKQRSYLMGWREGSGTAAIYTRRHTRRRAAKASLEMQAAAFRGSAHDKG